MEMYKSLNTCLLKLRYLQQNMLLNSYLCMVKQQQFTIVITVIKIHVFDYFREMYLKNVAFN